MRITLWYRIVKDKFIYNHFGDGWDDSISPIPESEEQKVWLNFRWAKELGYLENNTVKYHI